MAALALGAGAGVRAQTSLVSNLSETQSGTSLQVDSGVVHYGQKFTGGAAAIPIKPRSRPHRRPHRRPAWPASPR